MISEGASLKIGNIRKVAVFAWGLLGLACESTSSQKAKPLPDPVPLANIVAITDDGGVVVLADRSTWLVHPEQWNRTIGWQLMDLVEARRKGKGIEYDTVLSNRVEGTSVSARRAEDFQ
jgi:hypothetical protein